MHQYSIANMNLWKCRADAKEGDYFSHNVIAWNLDSSPLLANKFAFIGFASDLGVERNFGRVGAKLAPAIIRQFVSRLAIPYSEPCYDCGDILVDNHDDSLLVAQELLANKVAKIVKENITPIVLGGGHETAYGHYLGLTQSIKDNIAILNFDAHFDLRPVSNDNEGNSGTPFRQIHNLCQSQNRDFNYYCIGIQPRANTKELYEFAKQSQTTFIEAAEILYSPHKLLDLINQIISRHKYIYVTICLDVFHYSFAPGVSAPQTLGINPHVVIEALHLLRKSNCVLSLDIVELNPNFDIDNHTARLAASLIGEFYYYK